MQRYFIDDINEQNIVLSGEHYHHIVRVMRMKQGDTFYVVLKNQRTLLVEITHILDDTVMATCIQEDTRLKEMPIHVTIACGLPKGDKLEWIVQKATELGASAYIPFESKRSIVKWDAKKRDKKIDRLQKIAQEAAEQSHRTYVPQVKALASFEQLVQSMNDYTHIIIAYEEEAKQANHKSLSHFFQTLQAQDKVLAIFGCEGGLADEEVRAFVQKGALTCSLGPRILRAETAPLYFLSALSYYTECQ